MLCRRPIQDWRHCGDTPRPVRTPVASVSRTTCMFRNRVQITKSCVHTPSPLYVCFLRLFCLALSIVFYIYIVWKATKPYLLYRTVGTSGIIIIITNYVYGFFDGLHIDSIYSTGRPGELWTRNIQSSTSNLNWAAWKNYVCTKCTAAKWLYQSYPISLALGGTPLSYHNSRDPHKSTLTLGNHRVAATATKRKFSCNLTERICVKQRLTPSTDDVLTSVLYKTVTVLFCNSGNYVILNLVNKNLIQVRASLQYYTNAYFINMYQRQCINTKS